MNKGVNNPMDYFLIWIFSTAVTERWKNEAFRMYSICMGSTLQRQLMDKWLQSLPSSIGFNCKVVFLIRLAPEQNPEVAPNR